MQSRDIETAMLGVIEWQNALDKASRLFQYGLAKELVNEEINPNAMVEFEDLDMSVKLTPFMPKSNSELTQMLSVLVGAGITSKETATEVASFVNKPDEKNRLSREAEETARLARESKEETIKVENSNNSATNNNQSNNN